ncbi:Putative hydrolase/acyltransferase alpha/beta hydrolase superfamily, partial [Gryllus bimaculatus]
SFVIYAVRPTAEDPLPEVYWLRGKVLEALRGVPSPLAGVALVRGVPSPLAGVALVRGVPSPLAGVALVRGILLTSKTFSSQVFCLKDATKENRASFDFHWLFTRFKGLKTTYRGWFVDIGPVVGASDKVWTISLNEEAEKTPILLLHGFGRSSRPAFSSNATEAETQLVKSVEEWRREMNLDKFILLGHSMGGFLAASYAIQHPERVKHLILADPWGFPEKPENVNQKYNVPLWLRAVAYVIQPFNPLWPVRLAGPFGQRLIERMRPDIVRKFSHVVDDVSVIPEYIYQCNSQTPSGESAFRAMMSGFGWAKNPMLHRIDRLHEDIPMTILYGSRSWVENDSGDVIREKRSKSYVNVQIISGAGHHVYADKAEVFNTHVMRACTLTDELGKPKILPSPEQLALPSTDDSADDPTLPSRSK